ncbi:hypothetical protein [Hominiventricola filiformis]
MISIKEVKCPKCSADMEVFVRYGKTVGDIVYDKRKPGYTAVICNDSSVDVDDNEPV